MRTMKTVLEKNIQTSKDKILALYGDNFIDAVWLKALFGGFFIALGGFCSVIASCSIDNFSLSRIIAAAVFPMGLIFIVLIGGSLFTGDCLAINAIGNGYRVFDFLFLLVITWFGNFIGVWILCMLLEITNNFTANAGIIGQAIAAIADRKCSMTFTEAFFSGILCNIFVCMAILIATAAKSTVSKVIGAFLPIFAFVLCGFEHCVADMFYLMAGPIIMNNHGILVPANCTHITLGNCTETLIAVTLGNFLGGMIFAKAFKVMYGKLDDKV